MINDVYVQILKHVKESPNGQVTLNELKEAFPKQWELINREVQHNRLLSPIEDKWGMDNHFSLSFEDNFRLMEHQELVDARKSAKFAFWVAVISISLNVAALVHSSLTTENVKVTNLQDIAIDCNQSINKATSDKTCK